MTPNSNLIACLVGLAIALLTPALTAVVGLAWLLRRSQARERNEVELIEMYRAERREVLEATR